MEETMPVDLITVCPLCDGNVRQIRRSRKIAVGKRRVTADDELAWCDSCHEGFYLPGQLDALEARIAAQIRAKEGLLPPETIKAIRERLFLTQSEFERLLGVGPKTVARWEAGGAFPSAAVNTLLDVLDSCEGVTTYLAKKNGVTIVTPPPITTSEFQIVRRMDATKSIEEPPPEYLRQSANNTLPITVRSLNTPFGWDEVQIFGSRSNDHIIH